MFNLYIYFFYYEEKAKNDLNNLNSCLYSFSYCKPKNLSNLDKRLF